VFRLYLPFSKSTSFFSKNKRKEEEEKLENQWFLYSLSGEGSRPIVIDERWPCRTVDMIDE
jgi:hypothetical protein